MVVEAVTKLEFEHVVDFILKSIEYILWNRMHTSTMLTLLQAYHTTPYIPHYHSILILYLLLSNQPPNCAMLTLTLLY